jgi:hypothetical protein
MLRPYDTLAPLAANDPVAPLSWGGLLALSGQRRTRVGRSRQPCSALPTRDSSQQSRLASPSGGASRRSRDGRSPVSKETNTQR